MIHLVAFTGEDLLNSIDYRTDQRSHNCNSVAYRFDVNNWMGYFVTTCSKSKNSWEQRIQFVDGPTIVPEDKTHLISAIDQLIYDYPELLSTDIRVGCSCPAYRYFYSYIITQLESELDAEERFPHITNPHLDGSFCKHLATVIRHYFI
jgi:hypothetical protein